jgi:outer membrane autotransporter protein
MLGTRLLTAIMVPLGLIAIPVEPGNAQSTTISNTAQWNGVDGISSFGLPSDATYGQTFTAPSGARKLSSFAFFVDDNFPPPVNFQGFVMAWDGLKATGPVLFQSGALSTTDNHGAGGFERINVTISQGVSLNPGASYVAFFSASNFLGPGDSRVGVESSGAYPGGGFVFLNNGNNFNAVRTDNWDASFNFLDLAFEFVFAAAAGGGAPAAPPVVLVVDQAAIASVLFSAVPTALAQRELALGGSRTTLRDFNGRLFRRRAGAGGNAGRAGEDITYHTATVEDDAGAVRGAKDSKQVVYATARPEAQRWEVFTSFDYGNLELDASRYFLGVQSNTFAESIGVEHALTRHILLGGGVSYLESYADHGTDVAGETLAAYASAVWGGLYADLLYGATLLNHNINRDTGLGGTAHAEPGSATQTISFNAGYNFRPGRWSVGPIAGIDYAHAKIDGYTETGGGTAATRLSEQSVGSLLTRLGAQASYRIERKWGTLTPQLRLGWERENLGSDDDLTAGLVQSPYYLVQGRSIRSTGQAFEVTVPGQARARDSMTVGAGLLLEFGRSLQLLLDYEGSFLDDGYAAHYGKVSLGWKF